jgi:hypothetical protein
LFTSTCSSILPASIVRTSSTFPNTSSTSQP